MLTNILLTMLAGTISMVSTCVSARLLNEEEFVKKHDYASGKMPFTMRSSDLTDPVLLQKKDFVIESHAGGGLGFDLAYAASDKIGIYGKGSYRRARDLTSEYDSVNIEQTTYYEPQDGYNYYQTYTFWDYTPINTDHHLDQAFFELGTGMYRMKLPENLHLDWYGGLGIGTAKNNYTVSAPYHTEAGAYAFLEKRNYWLGFGQANIGYTSELLDITLLSRLAYLNFYKQSFDLDYLISTYDQKPSALNLEEGVRFGLGTHRYRFFMQYEMVIPLLNDDVKWYTGNLKGGVTLRFGQGMNHNKEQVKN